LAAAVAGDHEAVGLVYERLSPVLAAVGRGYRLGTGDVSDVVQATWERFWISRGSIRDPAALPAWLITTCRREALKLIRQRRRVMPVDDQTLVGLIGKPGNAEPSSSDPADQVTHAETAASLTAAIGRLPVHQRRVMLALQATDGPLTYQQISAELAIPIGSIGPTRQRAVQGLRRELALAGQEAA